MSRRAASLLKKNILCLIVLAAIIFILFFNFFVGGKIFLPADLLRKELPWKFYSSSSQVQNHYLADNIHVHYPWKVYLAREMKKGHFPLWCPLVGGGYPLFANPHYQYNLFLPFLLLLATPLAYNSMLIIELLFAGIFMFFLMREYQIGYFGSLLSGIVFMLNFLFMDSLFHEQQIGSLLWIPLIFLFFEKYKKKNKKYLLGLGSLFASIALFHGSLQSILYVYLAIILYFIHELLTEKTVREKIKNFSSLMMVLALSIFLSGICLIPIFEFLSFSKSAKIHLSLLTWLKDLPRIVLSLPLLTGFILPDLLGSHQALDLTKFLGLGGNVNGNLFKGYIGLIPLFFLAFALLPPKNYLIKKYLFIALAPIVLVVFSPLYYFLYFRAYIVTVFAMSILAGIGADTFIKKEIHSAKLKSLLKVLSRLFAIFLIVLLIFNGFLFKYENTLKAEGKEFVKKKIDLAVGLQYDLDWQLEKVDKMINHYKITNTSMYLPLVIAFIFIILVNFYMKNKIYPKAFILIILPIIIFDLMRFGWQLIPFVDKSDIFPQAESLTILRNDKSYFRVASLWSEAKTPPVFHPNTLLPYEIDTMDIQESIVWENKLKKDFKNYGYLNIKYVILPPEFEIEHESKNTFKEMYKKEVKILRNISYLDRVRFKSEILFCRDKTEMKAIFEKGNFDLNHKSLILTKEKSDSRYLIEAELNSGEIVNIEPNQIFVNADMKNGGFMEIAGNYYPGWLAYVDGKKETVYLSNGLFMGIFLPKGKHSIIFTFKPLSLIFGLYISIISLLALIGLILIENCRFIKKN